MNGDVKDAEAATGERAHDEERFEPRERAADDERCQQSRSSDLHRTAHADAIDVASLLRA